jgi:hypothetical protein
MAELIQVNGELIRAKPFRKQGIITDDHGIPWIAKVGAIVIDHWSLLPGWTEPGYEPMSEWHIEMQKKFADIGFQLEITRKSGEKEVKRADCYCEVRKLIVEIQKSPISETEAIERTKFWSSLGYDVMWIFHEERTYSGAQRRDTSPLCFRSAPKYLQLSGMATVLFQDCNGDFNVIMDYIELNKEVKESYRHCVSYVKHSQHDVLTLIVDNLEIATTGDTDPRYSNFASQQIEFERIQEKIRQGAIEAEKQKKQREDRIEIERKYRRKRYAKLRRRDGRRGRARTKNKVKNLRRMVRKAVEAFGRENISKAKSITPEIFGIGIKNERMILLTTFSNQFQILQGITAKQRRENRLVTIAIQNKSVFEGIEPTAFIYHDWEQFYPRPTISYLLERDRSSGVDIYDIVNNLRLCGADYVSVKGERVDNCFKAMSESKPGERYVEKTTAILDEEELGMEKRLMG